MDDELRHYRDALVTTDCPLVETLDASGAVLLETIEAAFADIGCCAGRTWIQGEMIDNNEDGRLIERGGAIDRYERWQDVPPMLLANFPSAGWFLADRDLAFYTPALMCWDIRFGKSPGPVPAAILEHRITNSASFITIFSTLQQHCIRQYLEYCEQRVEDP